MVKVGGRGIDQSVLQGARCRIKDISLPTILRHRVVCVCPTITVLLDTDTDPPNPSWPATEGFARLAIRVPVVALKRQALFIPRRPPCSRQRH